MREAIRLNPIHLMKTPLSFRHAFIAIGVLAFLLVLTVSASAQVLGANRGDAAGSGGNRSIQGRIFSGNRPPSGIRITLETPDAGTRTAFSDADGAFTFNNLTGGSYHITVDAGKEYEIVRESINLEGAAPVYQVPIYLRLKPENNPAFAGVPKAAIDLYNKGSEAARRGDAKNAAEQFRAAVDLSPQFSLALSELGVQYLKLGQADKAAEVLQAAVKAAPDDVIARLHYGIALLNLKKVDEAEKELRQVIAHNDALPTAHMYLGIILINHKKLEDAEQEFLKAIGSGSTEVAQAHRYLGGIYWAKREYKKAADELETYLKLSPKAADAEKTQAAIKELRSKQ